MPRIPWPPDDALAVPHGRRQGAARMQPILVWHLVDRIFVRHRRPRSRRHPDPCVHSRCASARALVGDLEHALRSTSPRQEREFVVGQVNGPLIAACRADLRRGRRPPTREPQSRRWRRRCVVVPGRKPLELHHQFDPPMTRSTFPRILRAVWVRMNSQQTAAPTLSPSASMTPSSLPPT